MSFCGDPLWLWSRTDGCHWSELETRIWQVLDKEPKGPFVSFSWVHPAWGWVARLLLNTFPGSQSVPALWWDQMLVVPILYGALVQLTSEAWFWAPPILYRHTVSMTEIWCERCSTTETFILVIPAPWQKFISFVLRLLALSRLDKPATSSLIFPLHLPTEAIIELVCTGGHLPCTLTTPFWHRGAFLTWMVTACGVSASWVFSEPHWMKDGVLFSPARLGLGRHLIENQW